MARRAADVKRVDRGAIVLFKLVVKRCLLREREIKKIGKGRRQLTSATACWSFGLVEEEWLTYLCGLAFSKIHSLSGQIMPEHVLQFLYFSFIIDENYIKVLQYCYLLALPALLITSGLCFFVCSMLAMLFLPLAGSACLPFAICCRAALPSSSHRHHDTPQAYISGYHLLFTYIFHRTADSIFLFDDTSTTIKTDNFSCIITITTCSRCRNSIKYNIIYNSKVLCLHRRHRCLSSNVQ